MMKNDIVMPLVLQMDKPLCQTLFVTDVWIVFQPGELANRGIYYNRKTVFWMTTKYFTEPYKTF